MFEVVAFLLGLVGVILGALFLRLSFKSSSSHQGGKPIPGWNRKPADSKVGDLRVALARGSLYDYLWQQHVEGSVPVVSFWWRDQRVVSVCSPQAYKDSECLYNKASLIFGPVFEPLHGCKNIQSLNGAEWKERRKLLQGTLRGQNLRLFIDDFVNIACDLKRKWWHGEPVNLLKEMFLATLKGILDTSLGNIFKDDSEIEELANFYHICKCEMDKCILDVLPPGSPEELKFQRNLKCLQDCLNRMLKARRHGKETKKSLPLLDALLKAGVSDEVVLSDMATYLGGFHTSGYYMTWTLLYLCQHPDVQEKLYKEIEETVGEDRGEKFTAYVLTSTSYLRQVLDEAMRYSTIANFTAYITDQDLMVCGHRIPAGTSVIQAIGVTMKSAAIWECPERFNPDRFSPGLARAKRDREFRPFGTSNLRRCPANQFTYLMVSVYLFILVHGFTLHTVDREEEQMIEGVYGIATAPKDDIFIYVKPRHQV